MNKRYKMMLRMLLIRGPMSRPDYLRKKEAFHHIGKRVMITSRKIPLYSKLISIGDNVWIASGVEFITHDVCHYMLNGIEMAKGSPKRYEEKVGCIKVGDNVFIGAGVKILYDVNIGDNVIIAAGTLVNKDIPSGSVAAGVPARVIGNFDDFVKNRGELCYENPVDNMNQFVSKECEADMWKEFYEKRGQDSSKKKGKSPEQVIKEMDADSGRGFSKLHKIIRNAEVLKPVRETRQILKSKKSMISKRDVLKAERNPELKRKLLRDFIKDHPERTKDVKATIKELFKEGSIVAEDREAIAFDMLYSCFAYGFSPNEYVCYGFVNKTLQQRKEFMSERESVCYGFTMNDIDVVRLFMNKARTYDVFKEYYKREIISISGEKDFERFSEFIKRHGVFVKKVADESCGRSIEKIDVDKIDGTVEELFKDLISEGETVLEELVQQGEAMSRLNMSSVNTIRCITVNQKGAITIPFCFLKVGRDGAFVDNGGAGGILAGIDEKTGVINTNGIDELNRKYEEHPDSGVTFKGYEFPKWQEMLSICREMAEKVPKAGFIGWDMAYTDNGWVVIEGNGLSEVIGPQSTSGEGIKKQLLSYIEK